MDNDKQVERPCVEIAAQLWCLPRHSHKEMDSELCEDIAKALSAEREKREIELNRAYMIGQCSANAGKYYSKDEFLKMCKDGFK